MFSHDTFEAWILFILAVVQSRFVYGYPGRRNQDGTYTLDVPGRPGYIYVTIWRGGQIGTDEAVNFGANANPNLLVRMERVNGKLVIISPDPSAAVALFGQYASMAAVPPHAALIGSGIDDPVEGRRFVPGLLAPSSSGGLNVMVFPFYTPYGYVAGDSAFAIDDPATTGKTAWVVVYADTNNDLQYVVGAEYDASTLDESTIPTDVTLPAGATPVGAVAVTNGGSVTTSSQFADYRFHFNTQRSAPVNWLNFDDSSELTIASGAVTATQTWHRIDTEGDASSDDLDTINGGSDGRTLIFRAENTARTVVVKHGTGNIQTFTGSDITLDETYKVVIAVYDGVLSKWLAFGVGGGGGGGSLPAFGAAATKTISSGVATAGSDRHLIIAAESGTTDDLIEISGLSAGDEVILRADAGDTITLKHNNSGATDKILLYAEADLALSGDKTLKLVKTASGKVVQYIDERSSGDASPLTTKGDLYTYDTDNTRLAVGLDGQVLAADSGEPTGLRWVTPASLSGVNVILRGTYASLPMSGDAVGDLYVCTDAPYTLQWDGSAWKARHAEHEVTPPSTSGFAWTNQGSATATANGVLTLYTPGNGSGNSMRVYAKSIPSTPYTITIGFKLTPLHLSNSAGIGIGGGLCWRDSATGRLVTLYLESVVNGTQTLNLFLRTWTNPTTLSGTYTNANLNLTGLFGNIVWLRVTDDGTNFLIYYSADGTNFVQYFSVSRTNFLANPDQIGYVLRADGSASVACYMQVLSWVQT